MLKPVNVHSAEPGGVEGRTSAVVRVGAPSGDRGAWLRVELGLGPELVKSAYAS